MMISPAAHGQETYIYIDHSEVEGLLDNGSIPAGGTITIPIRFINIAEPRHYISNGYEFSGGDGVSWTGITGEWNSHYPWETGGIIQPQPWFDLGVTTDYFEDGIGFKGEASPDGLGMPPGFAEIAYYISVTGITGESGDVFTLDSSWWVPSNYWVWSDTEVDWGGPYEFTIETPPPGPPEIVSLPPTIGKVGELYTYDMDAIGNPDPTYFMTIFPDGATIDPVTGLVEWIPEIATIPSTHTVKFKIHASNIHGEVYQYFGVKVYPDGAWTTCWPQPTVLKALENDRLLNVTNHGETNDELVLESVRVLGKIPPYTEVRIECDSIVTDCFIMQFLGMSGFRPIPAEGVQSTYTVEYDRTDGQHVVLTGSYWLGMPWRGDVTLDGTADIDDILFMTDYAFNNGPGCNLYGEPLDEFMDVDQNGRFDLLDIRELIQITGQ